MKTYATPKAALFDHGKIKAIGKGRISRENHAWLESEISAGNIQITGATIVKSETSTVVKTVGPTEKHIPDITILYDKRDYHALGPNGEKYGMAEVCNTCRVSLVQNQCEHPTILGGIPVRIIPNE